MATVGTILKTRRGELKLTLEDVSRKTKVGVKFLAAIENEEYDLLPPLSYSIGFVRLYAGAVGLDPGAVSAQFKHEARPPGAPIEDADEALPDHDIVRKSFPFWALIAVIAFILITSIAYYGWLRATPQAKTPGPAKPAATVTATGTAK